MNKFIKSNALTSLLINLAVSIVIPFFVLLYDSIIYLKESTPVLLPCIMAAVFLSAMVTCLITFFFITNKRKKGEINLPMVCGNLKISKENKIKGFEFTMHLEDAETRSFFEFVRNLEANRPKS